MARSAGRAFCRLFLVFAAFPAVVANSADESVVRTYDSDVRQASGFSWSGGYHNAISRADDAAPILLRLVPDVAAPLGLTSEVESETESGDPPRTQDNSPEIEEMIEEWSRSASKLYLAWWLQLVIFTALIFCACVRGKPPELPRGTGARLPVSMCGSGTGSLSDGSSRQSLLGSLWSAQWYFDWYALIRDESFRNAESFRQDVYALAQGCCCPCILWADMLHYAALGNGWWIDFMIALSCTFSNLLIPVPVATIVTLMVFGFCMVETRVHIHRLFCKDRAERPSCLDATLPCCCCALALIQQKRQIEHAYLVGHPRAVAAARAQPGRFRGTVIESSPDAQASLAALSAAKSTASSSSTSPAVAPSSAEPKHWQGAVHAKVVCTRVAAPAEAKDDAGEREDTYSINLEFSIYDAVIVASFGGLRAKIVEGLAEQEMVHDAADSAGGWDRDFMFVPPLLVLAVGALPLYMLQETLMWCMILDTPLHEELELSPSNMAMLQAKCWMILVLTVFSTLEMRLALRAAFFSVNPATWKEFPRSAQEVLRGRSRKLFRAKMCGLCCLIAQGMQFHVAYNVLVLSLTVVLHAKQIPDVLFNGLALIFITELDDIWYRFLAKAFRFDETCFESVSKEMKIHNPIRDRETNALRWFSWSRKAYARKVSQLLSGGLLAFISQRQLVDFYVSACTAKMPLWRLICDFYQGTQHRSVPSVIRLWLWLLSAPTYFFFGVKTQVEQKAVKEWEAGLHDTRVNFTLPSGGNATVIGTQCYPDFHHDKHALTSWDGIMFWLHTHVYNEIQARETCHDRTNFISWMVAICVSGAVLIFVAYDIIIIYRSALKRFERHAAVLAGRGAQEPHTLGGVQLATLRNSDSIVDGN